MKTSRTPSTRPAPARPTLTLLVGGRSAAADEVAPAPRAGEQPSVRELRRVAPAPPSGARVPSRELRRLVAGAAAGDEACWTRLVECLSALVRGVARAHRLTPADVEDVTQATWCKLVAHISTLRDAERLPAWLVTTARRESLRTLAGAQRQIPHGDHLPEPNVSEPSVDEGVLRDERDAELWAAVGRLRPSDQALLRMLVAEDGSGQERSYREIADTLGVAVGTIGPTRGRALGRLHETLADPDGLRPLAA